MQNLVQSLVTFLFLQRCKCLLNKNSFFFIGQNMFLPHRISDFRVYFNGRLHKRILIYRCKFWIELVNNFFQVNSYQTGPICCLWQNKAMPALIRQLRSHAELKQIMVTLNYFFLGWMRWQPSSSSGAKKNSFFHSFTLQTSFNQWDGKLLTFYHSSYYCMQWILLCHLLPQALL